MEPQVQVKLSVTENKIVRLYAIMNDIANKRDAIKQIIMEHEDLLEKFKE